MAHSKVQHTYHLVDPSPWPVVCSLGLFLLAFGGIVYMKGLFGLPQGNLLSLLPGFALITYVLIGWWRDVIMEGVRGDHTEVVSLTLRYGMVLFIASEVMFFAGWFWSFFEMLLYYDVRASAEFDVEQFGILAQWETWPPMQTDGHRVETFDPFHLPLINTLVLLLSGTTVTWAHHALQHNNRRDAAIGLALTVALGILFTSLQVIEYSHAHFTYGGSLYGSAFFMATGFHGAHVVIGTLFLAVCLGRLLRGGMSADKHLGFEFAAWYWHFVDVVWLFLFMFVYVFPRLVLGA